VWLRLPWPSLLPRRRRPAWGSASPCACDHLPSSRRPAERRARRRLPSDATHACPLPARKGVPAIAPAHHSLRGHSSTPAPSSKVVHVPARAQGRLSRSRVCFERVLARRRAPSRQTGERARVALATRVAWSQPEKRVDTAADIADARTCARVPHRPVPRDEPVQSLLRHETITGGDAR
jgi:hypothetical protein